jgi:hypothetical protein
MDAVAFFNTLLESQSKNMAAYRDYSHSSALELSQCYEALNNYTNALKWAREAQTRYPSQSVCGTGMQEEKQRSEQRIRELEKKLAEQGTAANGALPRRRAFAIIGGAEYAVDIFRL